MGLGDCTHWDPQCVSHRTDCLHSEIAGIMGRGERCEIGRCNGWLRRLPYGAFGVRLDGTIGYGRVVGCLAVPALDYVLEGIESGQLAGPTAGAGGLKD